MKKNLEHGNVEDANAIVYGGKEHSRSYLLGRLTRQREPKEKSATRTAPKISDEFMASVTEKIREQIAKDMEEKMEQKVRENVTLILSKFAEKNPALNVDVADLTLNPPNNDDASGADIDTP